MEWEPAPTVGSLAFSPVLGTGELGGPFIRRAADTVTSAPLADL